MRRNALDQLVNNFDEAVRIDASRTERTRVVIVGAGIAGLAAAKTLEDADFTDYLLLEGISLSTLFFYIKNLV